MAFVIEQRFEDVQHEYDREGDVLYISFGPPIPGVALTVEDWLAIRLAPASGQICGLTIIGFKRIFSNLRPDLLENPSLQVDKLKRARFLVTYSDESDTLTFRFEEGQPAYFERFDSNIYLEYSLVGRGIIGFRITRYTEEGEPAMERLLSSMIDALFAPPGTLPGPADALSRTFLLHLDIPRLLSFAA